jgi:adenylate kinase
VCEKSQTPYTGKQPGSPCEKNDGGKLVRRKDDEPEAIRTRLRVYEEQTAPVLDWYKKNDGKVVVVGAVGEVGAITERALEALRT